ncbi:MAG: alpha/beta hydrolase [Actinomycetota bacterium]|nr:alpha/beta hydrolase [Actinomycetota bacterium]
MERVWESGEVREVRLGEGVVRYREMGEGEPILFVHGFLVNGGLWRNVASLLSEHFRCIVPDWPLGAHTLAMESRADLTLSGLARLVADFMDALDLRDVTLVGNDTGGAISQIVIAHHPERVGRLVLTNCDAFEHFPPALILPFKWGAFVPGFAGALAHALRLPPVKRLLYALVARRQPGRAVLDSYFAPLIREPGVRRDVTKVMRAVSRSYTLEAARAFPAFGKPVLIAWGEDDLIFPIRDAERLQESFPDARLARVARSRCFIPEDQPRQLVELIESFLNSRAGAIR